jgi:hypothetical protein
MAPDMKLVREDKYGAYIEATPALLEKFVVSESNPNFDVFDANDGHTRLVIAKSSRLPDDDNLTQGRYGINYHRGKPGYDEALKYREGMRNIKDTRHLLNDMAFVAAGREEYAQKAAVWDSFYTYIWGEEPLHLWVTPHSGSVDRPPDPLIPWPKQEHDAFVSGVAAACALADNAKPRRRTMVSLHSHNWLGAVLDIGGFGINDKARLLAAEHKLNHKYHDAIQPLAAECKARFAVVAMDWINHIWKIKHALSPRELAGKSTFDQGLMTLITKSLKMYGQEIILFTPEEFAAAIGALEPAPLQAVSHNYLFSGEHISELLELKEHISRGHLDAAIQIECSKIFLEKAPELVTTIILDIKQELFSL